MNGYIAIYKGKQIEVMAETSYKAQVIAAEQFGAKKSYEVTVMLAEKNGEQVTHRAADSKTSDASTYNHSLMHLEEAQRAKVKDAMLVRENMFYKLMQNGAASFTIVSKLTGSTITQVMETLDIADKVFDDISARQMPGKDSSPTIFKDGMERMKMKDAGPQLLIGKKLRLVAGGQGTIESVKTNSKGKITKFVLSMSEKKDWKGRMEFEKGEIMTVAPMEVITSSLSSEEWELTADSSTTIFKDGMERAKGKDAKTKDYHTCENMNTDGSETCYSGCKVPDNEYQVRKNAKCPYLVYGESQQRCNCYI